MNKKIKLALLGSIAILITGCATSSQEISFTDTGEFKVVDGCSIPYSNKEISSNQRNQVANITKFYTTIDSERIFFTETEFDRNLPYVILNNMFNKQLEVIEKTSKDEIELIEANAISMRNKDLRLHGFFLKGYAGGTLKTLRFENRSLYNTIKKCIQDSKR